MAGRELETSRNGYLGALGVSAYSFVSMVRSFSPLMRPDGSFLSLTYTGTIVYVDKGFHTMGKTTEDRYSAP